MAEFVKGDVVVVPFPFSDLSESKRRPALVITPLEGEDILLCQITSQTVKDSYAILIEDKDFETGSLKQSSYVRPNRLFTADTRIILYHVGRIGNKKMKEVVRKIIEIVEA